MIFDDPVDWSEIKGVFKWGEVHFSRISFLVISS
ncbi:MAG: hypothetical protein ACJAQT_003347 [Akkermansiaceae bacterium]|jgi:hypothetical protein